MTRLQFTWMSAANPPSQWGRRSGLPRSLSRSSCVAIRSQLDARRLHCDTWQRQPALAQVFISLWVCCFLLAFYFYFVILMPANNLIKRFAFFSFLFLVHFFMFFGRFPSVLPHFLCAHIAHTLRLLVIGFAFMYCFLFLWMLLSSCCLCNFHFVNHVDISLISCYMHPAHHTHSHAHIHHSLIFICYTFVYLILFHFKFMRLPHCCWLHKDILSLWSFFGIFNFFGCHKKVEHTSTHLHQTTRHTDKSRRLACLACIWLTLWFV